MMKNDLSGCPSCILIYCAMLWYIKKRSKEIYISFPKSNYIFFKVIHSLFGLFFYSILIHLFTYHNVCSLKFFILFFFFRKENWAAFLEWFINYGMQFLCQHYVIYRWFCYLYHEHLSRSFLSIAVNLCRARRPGQCF